MEEKLLAVAVWSGCVEGSSLYVVESPNTAS